MRDELSAAVKELALLVRTRLESCFAHGAGADYAAIEALIIMQKAVESAETESPAVATRMIALASELLLELPTPATQGELLERWAAELDPVGALRVDS